MNKWEEKKFVHLPSLFDNHDYKLVSLRSCILFSTLVISLFTICTSICEFDTGDFQFFLSYGVVMRFFRTDQNSKVAFSLWNFVVLFMVFLMLVTEKKQFEP